MPDYIPQRTPTAQNSMPTRKQHSLHAWNRPRYGATQQFATPEHSSEKLPPSGILCVQKITGSLLYYVLAVDCNLLVALGDLASAQTTASEHTWTVIVWLLNYAAAHPNTNITYHASDMCLHTHINASYLSVPQTRSRAEGHFFLSSKPKPSTPSSDAPINGPIHVISNIVKNVMRSVAEAEIGAGYINAREVFPIRA